jgi:hypothetical protein
MLDAKFPELSASLNGRPVRKAEQNSEFLQQFDGDAHTFLLFHIQAVPSRLEFVGVRNLRGHSSIISPKDYSFKGIML